MSGMIVIPASLSSDFIHIAGMTIPIALESTIHITGIRKQETEPSQTGLRWRGESQVECPPGDYSYCACSRLYSPLHSSYERGCPAKTLLHSSPGDLDRCLHPGPFFFVEKILVLTPGAPQSQQWSSLKSPDAVQDDPMRWNNSTDGADCFLCLAGPQVV